eukprot:g67301.t1
MGRWRMGRPEHEAVWLDIFCKNQHIVEGEGTMRELGACVRSCWHPALSAPRLLVVVDKWPQPSLVARVWCVFELWTAVECGAIISPVLAQAAAQGKLKLKDETKDPLGWIASLQGSVAIRNAQATVASDKAMILSLVEQGVATG